MPGKKKQQLKFWQLNIDGRQSDTSDIAVLCVSLVNGSQDNTGSQTTAIYLIISDWFRFVPTSL